MVEVQFFDSPEELSKSGTPLRRFWGTTAGVEPRQEQDRNIVQLQFTEVEVIPYPADHAKYPSMPGQIAPYSYPIAQLDIAYRLLPRTGQPSENSTWGLFVKSVGAVGLPRARAMVGQRVLMEADPDYEFSPARPARLGYKVLAEDEIDDEVRKDPQFKPAQEAIHGMVWQVVEIAGQHAGSSNSKSETEQFLDILHGKTRSEFVRHILQTELGRKHQESITKGELLNLLIATGRVALEGDRYKVSPA